MWLDSTAGKSPPVTFRQALLEPMAPDGGLYVPASWPAVSPADLAAWRGASVADLAVEILGRWVGDEFGVDVLARLMRAALTFPVPVRCLGGRYVVAELFHGPTLAFKDFGAQTLARLLHHVVADRGERAAVLVATSGDTGGAVAQAFYGLPGIEVVVLYPAGRISRFQEAQIAGLDGNVTAVRVPGTFDDCQRLVKTAFGDRALGGVRLSSANSINIGRLLPQCVYYVSAYVAAVERPGDPVVFAVPSGNLGNLTAGVIAQRLGLPVRRFVAALNVNRVLADYLASGRFEPRRSIQTMSSAMDVGDPSNFARLLALHGRSLDQMRRNLWSVSIDEETTRRTIRDAYRSYGYLFDPHSAVGFAAAQAYEATSSGDEPIVVLATAHPAKFNETIAEILDVRVPLPESHRHWHERPVSAVALADTRYETFRDLLLARLAQ